MECDAVVYDDDYNIVGVSLSDCLETAKSIKKVSDVRNNIPYGYEDFYFEKDYCPNNAFGVWKGYNFDNDSYKEVACEETVCGTWRRECLN